MRSGCGIIERAQEHAVDDRENRGAGADPERERENGDGGETGRGEQLPEGVAKVVQHNSVFVRRC